MSSPSLRPLRPHQVAALDQLRVSLASGHVAPLLAIPTGGGKTRVAAEIVSGLRSRMRRVCFCVPTIGLVDQTVDRFRQDGIELSDMGVLQGNHPMRRPHAPIQIATLQTLSRRSLPDVDAVIVDEAHLQFEVLDDWIREALKDRNPATARSLPKPFFIGLSATPWSRGLGKKFDDLIKPTSLSELIEDGFLSRFKVYAPSHPDLSGVKTVAGDYHEGQLGERMNTNELVADVIGTWLAKGNNEPTLCFATGRLHAQALHQRFVEVGVPAAYIDANTPREERDEIGRELETGKVKVVVNIGCLTAGIDWTVRCLILARPTKSPQLFVQIIGRSLRVEYASGYDLETREGRLAAIAAGPKAAGAVVLDHSDTHLRLGMVTDIDFDVLDDGKPRPKADPKAKDDLPLPKECPTCSGLIPANASACPCCGSPRPKPLFQEAEGHLEEMAAGGAKKRASGGLGPVGEAIVQRGKQQVYSELLWFAEERSRSSGWVAHQYREVFGVWPRGLDDEVRIETSSLVRSWIRSRDIAWAKSQPRRVEVSHA